MVIINETESAIIRIKKGTKEVLDSLKLIDRESYDSVIHRVIQYTLEDELELNDNTKKLLNQRMLNLRAGKAMSTQDLLKRIREKQRINAR